MGVVWVVGWGVFVDDKIFINFVFVVFIVEILYIYFGMFVILLGGVVFFFVVGVGFIVLSFVLECLRCWFIVVLENGG